MAANSEVGDHRFAVQVDEQKVNLGTSELHHGASDHELLDQQFDFELVVVGLQPP